MMKMMIMVIKRKTRRGMRRRKRKGRRKKCWKRKRKKLRREVFCPTDGDSTPLTLVTIFTDH